MEKQTALDWFYDKIKSHFEHDGDLLESLTFTMAIAKQKERDQLIALVEFVDNDLIDNVPPIEIVDRFLSK